MVDRRLPVRHPSRRARTTPCSTTSGAAASSPRTARAIDHRSPRATSGSRRRREPVKVDVAEWNEYTIIARGNHLIHKLNGQVTADVIDHQASERELEGLLAIQIHRGPAMNVQIKDIVLKELPDGERALARASADAGRGEEGRADWRREERARRPRRPTARSDRAASRQAVTKDVQFVAAQRSRRRKAGPQGSRSEAGGGDGPGDRREQGDAARSHQGCKGFQGRAALLGAGGEQGSWVNLCVDDKGRIIASDQYGGLFRFAPPPAGQPLDPATIEKVPAEIRAVNGMLWAFGALYVGVNDYEKQIASGLYRITDSDGDDQLDKVELLRAMEARGDHGVHALLPTPDGKALFLVTGNGTKPTAYQLARACRRSGARIICCRGCPMAAASCATCSAPGGIIYRVSPDGKEFEVVFVRLSQHLRRGAESRRRAVHLRRRHGVRLQHVVVSAHARLPRRQRQRVRLAQRRGQAAGVLSRQSAAGAQHRPRLAHRHDLRLRREVPGEVSGGAVHPRLELGQAVRHPSEARRARPTRRRRRSSSPARRCR